MLVPGARHRNIVQEKGTGQQLQVHIALISTTTNTYGSKLKSNNKIDFFAAQCLFCKNSRQVDKQCHFRAKNVCGYLAKSCCGLQKHKHAIRY